MSLEGAAAATFYVFETFKLAVLEVILTESGVSNSARGFTGGVLLAKPAI